MYVKGQQTYTEDVTISTDGAHIFIESGTTLAGAWLITGSNCVIEFGADTTLTGTLITNTGTGNRFVFGANSSVSGVITLTTADHYVGIGAGGDINGIVTVGPDCKLICENGVALIGIVMAGARGYVNGGGWGTVTDGGTATHGINVTAADCRVENISALTTAGGGNAYHAFTTAAGGDRGEFINCRVVDADDCGFFWAGDECVAMFCKIENGDTQGIFIYAPRARVIGNWIANTGSVGVLTGSPGDHSVINGNFVWNVAVGAPINLDTNSEDCVVVGNKLDGAVSDSSGTSTVASNEETAF